MKKNQIFIKCGTEYKEMTKELLEACDLEGELSLIHISEPTRLHSLSRMPSSA